MESSNLRIAPGKSSSQFAIIAVDNSGDGLESLSKKEETVGSKVTCTLDWSEADVHDGAPDSVVLKVQVWGKDEVRMQQCFLGEVCVCGEELQNLYLSPLAHMNKAVQRVLKPDLECDLDHNMHVDLPRHR